MIKYIFILLIFLNNVYASDIINITFLGTGTPRPDINKLGPSILLKYKKNEILFDVGRGATLRLGQLDNNYSNINDIFISHMHFDHIVGLADFWLTSSLWQKKTDTNIYGPKYIKNFCKQLKKMYKKDLEYRYKKGNYSKINCLYHKVVSKDKNQLKITPFENDHGHVDESYGFRIDFGSKKIVYSGDTTYSKDVISNSKNADILIHEVIAASKKIYNNNKKLRKVVSSHTDVNQLIEILKTCKPKLTILNHALLFGVSENDVLSLIEREYKGKVIFAKDLMSIDLGEEINIFNTGNYK
tara:strand:- start:1220 stop:2116 length:897 start_codon:yes stop_codon:yes gene_type:complete